MTWVPTESWFSATDPGWRALDAAYCANLKNTPEPDKETESKALPELTAGQSLPLSGTVVKEGKTSPPKHFTDEIYCNRGVWNTSKKGAG